MYCSWSCSRSEPPNPALQPTPFGRVRGLRVPALGGILRERGAAERHAVRRTRTSRIEMKNADADQAIENLLGTIGADLNSLRREARRLLGLKPEPDVGHLNFALALLALVGCEAAGFFMTGGSKEERETCRTSDSGSYITQFIESFFPSPSDFRRVSKILADDLRHELVHGFGSRNPERPFELQVLVAEPPVASVALGRDAKTLRVNSLLLADDTAAALLALRQSVETDPALAARVAVAAAIRFPVQAKVQNQFEAFVAWHRRQQEKLGA